MFMRLFKLCVLLLHSVFFIVALSPALAVPLGDAGGPLLSDQWYIGLGGGAAFLQPNPVDSDIDSTEEATAYTTMTLGRDLSTLSSVQLQLHSLGAGELTNAEKVTYSALDATVVYRFYDSRDRQLVPGRFGLALYGIAGLGGISRDIDSNLPLKNSSQFYLSYGGGAELFLGGRFSLRLQGAVIDRDAQYAALTGVMRFGGQVAQRPTSPVGPDTQAPEFETKSTAESTPVLEPLAAPLADPIDALVVLNTASQVTPDSDSARQASPALPPELPPVSMAGSEPDQVEPSSASRDADEDEDGIPDAIDECAGSRSGFPVREDGCAMLNGVLSQVRFDTDTANLLQHSLQQLDALANLLNNYPQSRIQILAHTDGSASEKEQAILSRARLRSIGTYLLGRGVRANRLILISRRGRVPVDDNATLEGRVQNNRIEVLEHF